MLSCDIAITRPFGRKVDRKWLRRVAQEVCTAEGVDYPAALSVAITDDETVRQLNRHWRGIDRTTDVLSFSFQEGNASFHPPPDGITQLGEIVISLPQAQRQAERMGHPLKSEITILLIHGMLHLLGYDHRKPAERKKMRAREGSIRAQLMEGNTDEERTDH